MKIAVCVAYVVLQFVYLSIGDGRIWGGVNIITHIAFVGYLCHLLHGHVNETERLFFSYLKWLSLFSSLYIVACMLRNTYWILYNTSVMALVMGISFMALLITVAIKRK